MRHASGLILMAAIVLLSTGAAWAAGVPWKNGEEPVDPATLEEMKADLGEPRFKRLVAPIESKVQLAEKAMVPYQKEMEKPPDKRRAELLQKCKIRSAQMHVAAAQAAMRAQNSLHKTSHRARIKETYEEPNRKKAIRIYEGLGLDARAAGNIPQAGFFYKQVLSVDPSNQQARTALKELAQEYRQAMQDRKYRGKSSGGDSDDRKSWDWDRDADYNRDWSDWRNYSGSGRGGWY